MSHNLYFFTTLRYDVVVRSVSLYSIMLAMILFLCITNLRDTAQARELFGPLVIDDITTVASRVF
jgi:hypothetical protein